MNEDLQDMGKEDLQGIDNIFYNNIELYEEDPSTEIWNRLTAALDKKEAAIYKKKLINLYRIVAILIFLLVSLSLYEVGFIIKNNSNTIVQNEANSHIDKNTKDSNDFRRERPVEKNDHRVKNLLPIINVQSKYDKELPGKIILNKNLKNEKSLIVYHENPVIGTPEKYQQYQPPTDSIKKDFQKQITDLKQSFLPSMDSSLSSVINKPSQNNNKTKPFQPYWSATLFANREWAQYHLENNPQTEDNNNQYQDDKTSIAKREQHEPSYRFGLLATYQFQKKLSFQTGLSYSYTAIIIEPQKVYAVKDNNGGISFKYNTSSGYAFLKSTTGTIPSLGDSLYTTTAQHNLAYISIPVLMRYKMADKKFSLSAGAGFAVNLLSGAKIKTEIKNTSGYETVSVNRLQGIRSFYTDVIANADVQYNIKDRFSLNLVPSFRYALSPINKNTVVNTYPYSFGLGIGCTYKF